jgi:hypothetical protein
VPYPECTERFSDLPWLELREEGNDRTDVEYPMIVVESTDRRFRAEETGLPVDDAEPFVDVEFPFALPATADLPDVGQPIVLLGGTCDYKQSIEYFRLMRPVDGLFFEGGSPDCAEAAGNDVWSPHLGARDRPETETCSEVLESCCCQDRTEHDVILHADGDSVLVRGEDRIVEIDGASFLASSQGIYTLEVTTCTMLHSSVQGSAFLVRVSR